MPESHLEHRREGFPGQRLVVLPPAIVARAAKAPLTQDLCVTHIGHFSAAGGHLVERPQGAPEHILIACLAGAGTGRSDGREWRLSPGEIAFLSPRKPHSYEADEHSPWTIFWVHFRGLRAAAYLECLGVSGAAPVCAVDDPAVIHEAFEDTFRHVTHGFGEASLIGLTTAFARMLGVMKIHQARAGGRARQSGARLLRALTRMREDLARPWALADLAREAGMSAPHFTELCRLQSGMAPMALLARLRLQRAMALLQQGTHNVSEAAAAVGYLDPFYFSRQFRKHMGIPPSACKKGP